MSRGVAHGRVNLMGEHTDYNRGLVLPALLPQRTSIVLEPRTDERVLVRADGFGVGTYRIGAERRAGDWLDYVRAVTATLPREGHAIRGFEATVDSDLPVGAGVASSAAVLVALLRALREAFALALDDTALALLAQRAEVDFVGARVGIMDQLVASLGRPGQALFIDTADLSHELVPVPATLALVVVDSGVRHAHASGAYNARRRECEAAAAQLGLASLRDVRDTAALTGLDRTLAARARHIVTENVRVRGSVVALRGADARALGALFDESHASQRDDFAVSTPEVDALAAALRAQPGVYGARLTGGGFGGSVVAIARAADAVSAAHDARTVYERQTGRQARVLVPAT